MAAADLRRPLVSHAVELDGYFVDHAELALARSRGDSIVERVLTVLVTGVEGLRTTARNAARALALAVVSLRPPQALLARTSTRWRMSRSARNTISSATRGCMIGRDGRESAQEGVPGPIQDVIVDLVDRDRAPQPR